MGWHGKCQNQYKQHNEGARTYFLQSFDTHLLAIQSGDLLLKSQFTLGKIPDERRRTPVFSKRTFLFSAAILKFSSSPNVWYNW